MKPTIEQSAAAFRAGRSAYQANPLNNQLAWEHWARSESGEVINVTDDYHDGWRSAQREAEVERHIDEARE